MRIARAAAGSAVAAAIAVLVYARTLAPTVGAGDSGELILAAQGLGLPHPPGYALWLLFARLAAAAPIGTLALRVNALSAVSSAAAVGLFWLLARRTGLRPAAAAFGTALFAASTLVWAAAVEAEVYGLATAAFLALALLALRAHRRGASRRDEALFFFASGLCLVAHQTLLFPAALLAAWVVARRPLSGAWGGRAGAALGWALAGLSLTLVVPIRATANPAFAFGDARGIASVADLLLRRDYGGLAQNAFRLDRAAEAIAAMALLVARSLGWFGAVAALVGLFVAGRRRPLLLVLSTAALTIPLALVALIAFTPDAEHLAQIAPFLAPVAAAAALLAAGAAQSGLRRARGWARPVAFAAIAAVALVPLPARYAACDRSGFDLAERYGRDLLASAPAGAVLVLDGDNETFAAAYGSLVNRERPDLGLVHRRGRFFGDPYRLKGLPRSRWSAIQCTVDRARIDAGGRPVCYALPPEDLMRAGVRFRQRGLLYVAEAAGARADEAWRLPASWPRSSQLLAGHPERYDYVTRKMAVSYSDAAARRLWSEGRVEASLPWFQDAARVGFDIPEALLNLAWASEVAGRPEAALDALAAACRVAPYRAEPPARLALFLARAGRPSDAARWFERAFHAEPGSALASDAARAWTMAGDAARASVWSRRAESLGGASSPGAALRGPDASEGRG